MQKPEYKFSVSAAPGKWVPDTDLLYLLLTVFFVWTKLDTFYVWKRNRLTAQMENLVNSIYALQVTLQGFVLIQMIVTDVDKAASGKPGDYMV